MFKIIVFTVYEQFESPEIKVELFAYLYPEMNLAVVDFGRN